MEILHKGTGAAKELDSLECIVPALIQFRAFRPPDHSLGVDLADKAKDFLASFELLEASTNSSLSLGSEILHFQSSSRKD